MRLDCGTTTIVKYIWFSYTARPRPPSARPCVRLAGLGLCVFWARRRSSGDELNLAKWTRVMESQFSLTRTDDTDEG